MTGGTGPNSAGDVPFDQIRADVLPGAHLVARVPGVVLVLRQDGTADPAVSGELLALVREAAEQSAPAPGRELARLLTEFVVGVGKAPDFGTVAATEDGIAVFLRGDVSMSEVPDPGAAPDGTGQPLQFSGRTAAFAVDRLLPRPKGRVVLAAGPPRDSQADPVLVPGWPGLVGGLVPGDGVVLTPVAAADAAGADADTPVPASVRPAAQAPASAPVGPAGQPTEEHPAAHPNAHPDPVAPPPAEPALRATPPPAGPGDPVPAPAFPVGPPSSVGPVQPAPQPQPPPPPDAPAPVLRPPRVSDRIHGSNVHEARRPPLPVAGAKPAGPRPGSPAQPSHVLVKGFRCSRNHHNDPRVSFCSVCGIRMDQRTGILVDGRRPPLGLLVLDIGATFVLDDNYLIGRNPEVDEAVIRSRLRPIRLDDDSGTLSRVHAEIRLEGWDVLLLDRGSANGTHIAGAGQSGWTRLAPQQPVVLAPGMHVRVGRRMFTFESAHARI